MFTLIHAEKWEAEKSFANIVCVLHSHANKMILKIVAIIGRMLYNSIEGKGHYRGTKRKTD